MSSELTTRKRLRRVASLAVLATASIGALIPLAGVANASTGGVTALTASGPSAANAGSTITINYAATAPGGDTTPVKYYFVSGPDAIAQTTPPTAQGTLGTANQTSGTVTLASSNGGTDVLRVFADNNGSNTFDTGDVAANDISITVSGTPTSFAVSGASGGNTGTCLPLSVLVKDAGGRNVLSKSFTATISEPGAGTNVAFCKTHPNPPASSEPTGAPTPGTAVTPASDTVNGQTGADGSAQPLGITTDTPGTVTLTLTGSGNAPTATSYFFNFVAGGANSVTSVTVTPPATTSYVGNPLTFTATVKNASGQPVGGVQVYSKITGANPALLGPVASDSFGVASFTYTPANAGTDNVTSFVDTTTGPGPHQIGVQDGNDPSGTGTITVTAPPSGLAIDLTDSNASTVPDTCAAQNGKQPADASTENFLATVYSAAGTVAPGVTVNFAIVGAPTGASLSTTSGVTNAAGQLATTLTRTVAGPSYQVTATIAGQTNGGTNGYHATCPATPYAAAKSDTATVTFQARAAQAPTIAPTQVTTQVGTAQIFTATVLDQFGAPVSGKVVTFAVSGRNNETFATGTTGSNGQVSASQLDHGSTSSAAGTDTVTATTTEGTASATRYYTLTAPTAAAIEGGVGTPSEQFTPQNGSTTNTTSDDAASVQVPYTTGAAGATPTNVFFEVRNASNNSSLPGKAVSISSSGVGSLVSGSNNTPLTSPQTVTTSGGSPAYAQVKVLSTATGVETITGTVDGVSKSVTITWTAGQARNITVSPATATVVKGSTTLISAKVVDVFGNGVPGEGVSFSTTSNGTFGNGTNTNYAFTDPTGVASVQTTSLTPGTQVVTASDLAIPTKAANDPFAGAKASNKSGTSTLTVTATPTADSTKTMLELSPSTTQVVNNVVTATGTVADAQGNPVAGQGVRFTVSGATNAISGILTTDSNGQAAYPFTSSNPGVANVQMDVVSSGGVVQFSKTASVTFTPAPTSAAPRPMLQQRSRNGAVFLTVTTDKRFEGKSVYFFRRSGMTGRVIPVGMSPVDANGLAVRIFSSPQGGALDIYAKVVGVSSTDLPNPYTNDVAFHVL